MQQFCRPKEIQHFKLLINLFQQYFEARSGLQFLCGRVIHIALDGERDAYEAVVCNSQDAVIEFFGTDWLEKELYDRAEIESVEVIE
jgi:hypothetical protein